MYLHGLLDTFVSTSVLFQLCITPNFQFLLLETLSLSVTVGISVSGLEGRKKIRAQKGSVPVSTRAPPTMDVYFFPGRKQLLIFFSPLRTRYQYTQKRCLTGLSRPGMCSNCKENTLTKCVGTNTLSNGYPI